MNFRYVGQILILLAFAHFAWATPQVTTYQARIIKPDGYPLEAASVNFKFTILSPAGNCILYSETYSSVSMSGTGGLMSFPLGSGIRVYPASGTTFSDVFDNSVASLTCDSGGPTTYQPDASDIRKIVMQFNDGNGWQTLPAMNINAVPYAIYANDAMKLGGVSATSYVQYSTLPTCTASESLSYNGASFNCVVAGGAPTNVTSSTVITALGYTPADGASVTAVSSYAAAVSSTVYAVSSTVSTLANSVLGLQNNALVKTNNLSDLTNAATARTNLGLGTFATASSIDLGSASATGTIADARLVNQSGVTSGAQYTKVTVDAKGRVISGAQLILSDVTTALGYTPADSATGLTSLNGSTSQTQTFANGLSGNSPAFVTANGVHTLSIPLASAAGSVTAGLISNADYINFNNKITSSAASIAQVLGYTPASATALASYLVKSNNLSDLTSSATARINLGLGAFATMNSLDLGSASATGTLAIARLPAFIGDVTSSAGDNTLALTSVGAGVISGTQYTKVTVDGKGRVTNGAQLAAADVETALGYTPANSATTISSQWITEGTAIGYVSGSVGVGTTTPQGKLNVTGGDLYVGTGTPINTSASEDIFAEGNLEVHGAQGITIGSTAGGFLVANTNSNRRSLTLTGSGTASSESAGHLILGNNRTTAAASDMLGLIEFGTSGNGGSSANRSGAKIETRLSGAGGANGFGAYTAFSTKPDNVAGVVEVMRITADGNIGIGTTIPGSNTKLNVAGQIKTGSASITTGAVDWNVGNSVATSFDCSSNITFANLRDGGNYTLVVTSTGTTQCNFSAALTGDDSGTVSYRFKPANTVRDGSTHTIYSLMRVGNIVYVSWISGF